MEESDYNNIYLLPIKTSLLDSRNQVILESDFHGLYPIFSSPMKGVSGEQLVIAMAENSCLGILHRFATSEERVRSIHKFGELNIPFGVAIGVSCWDIEFDIATCAFEQGAKMLCVDLANGHLNRLGDIGKRLRDRFGSEISLMTGNIVTAQAAQFLKDSGYDFVRCSIGSGACCTTRLATGVGRNALAVLKECSDVDINLVIDGGIRHTADMVKSFACGADYIMLGSVLAYSKEADNTGKIYGMASKELHIVMNKDIKSIEGKEIEIDIAKKFPASEIINRILWDIRSACTYLGCYDYHNIPNNCRIVPTNEKFWEE